MQNKNYFFIYLIILFLHKTPAMDSKNPLDISSIINEIIIATSKLEQNNDTPYLILDIHDRAEIESVENQDHPIYYIEKNQFTYKTTKKIFHLYNNIFNIMKEIIFPSLKILVEKIQDYNLLITNDEHDNKIYFKEKKPEPDFHVIEDLSHNNEFEIVEESLDKEFEIIEGILEKEIKKLYDSSVSLHNFDKEQIPIYHVKETSKTLLEKLHNEYKFFENKKSDNDLKTIDEKINFLLKEIPYGIIIKQKENENSSYNCIYNKGTGTLDSKITNDSSTIVLSDTKQQAHGVLDFFAMIKHIYLYKKDAPLFLYNPQQDCIIKREKNRPENKTIKSFNNTCIKDLLNFFIKKNPFIEKSFYKKNIILLWKFFTSLLPVQIEILNNKNKNFVFATDSPSFLHLIGKVSIQNNDTSKTEYYINPITFSYTIHCPKQTIVYYNAKMEKKMQQIPPEIRSWFSQYKNPFFEKPISLSELHSDSNKYYTFISKSSFTK